MPKVDSITFFDPDRTNVTALHGVLPELDGRGLYNVPPMAATLALTQDGGGGCEWNAGHTAVTVTQGS